MNKHLQSILNSIQQSQHLNADEKNALLKSIKDADKEFVSTEFKLDRTEKVKRTTAILLEETIEELEQKRKAVEAQNRELEIEASLERVRTVAMSMNKPDDLLHICKALFNELKLLGFTELRNALINTFNDKQTFFNDYDYSDLTGGNIVTIPYDSHPLIKKHVKKIRSSTDAFAETVVEENELESWKENRRKNGEPDDPRLENISALYYYFYSIGIGAIGISAYKKISDEQLAILKRFRNVFDLAYKRYIDITNAEAQSRESQIQLALERLRARTMAMQHSNELLDAATLLFQQINSLGTSTWNCSFNIWAEDKNQAIAWNATKEGFGRPFISPSNEDVFKRFYEAALKGEELYVEAIGGDALKHHYDYLSTLPGVNETLAELKAAGVALPTFQIFNIAYFTQGYLMFITYEPVPELWDIFKRFAKVFEQTYTRFLDLQKAEAQSKESQIQLALERVRARTMAMQKSDELSDAVYVLFQQFKELGEKPVQATIGVINEDEKVIEYWVTMHGNPINKVFKFPIDEPNVTNKIYNAWKENKKSLVIDLGGDALMQFMKYRAGKGGAAINPNEKRRIINVAFFSRGLLNVQSNEERSEESIKLLERFASVFEQTYTRFLDLQKAEAQAREAQIEAALERVRSRTMAMQKSDELTDVAGLLFAQVNALGIKTWTAGFNVWSEDNNSYVDYITSPNGGFIEPYTVHTEKAEALRDISDARKSGVEFDVQYVEGEKIKQLYLALTKLDEKQYEIMLQDGVRFPSHQYEHFVFGSKVSLMFITYEPVPEAHDIFKRLGKVFEQTYTRFLDLQKAEAQTRESQIELALERVRARTMAMQHSDELKNAAAVLFQQAKELGISAFSCGYNIWEDYEKTFTSWMSAQDGSDLNGVFNIPLTDDANFIRYVESKQKGEDFFDLELRGERMQEHYRYLKTIPAFKAGFDYAENEGIPLPEKQIHYLANFSHGNLLFITLEPCPEFHDVFKRFAKVFEQTYTRFLDLQKAEAQAREAEIELALERVRARTMAMQQSDELADASLLLDQQIRGLGIKTRGCAFNIYGEKESTEWFSNEMGTMQTYKTPREKVFLDYYQAGQKGETLLIKEFSGKECIDWYNYLCTLPGIGDGLKQMIASGGSFPIRQIDHVSFFKYGYLLFLTFEPVPEFHEIFKRFAKVFEQTYTRFLDLQKAEEQTREAQVEAALEKVRSRTLAMQKSDELAETSAVLFKQLIKLGIAPNRLYIGVIHDESGNIEFWITDEDGSKVSTMFSGNTYKNASIKKMYDGWKQQKKSVVIDMQGKELKDYFHYLGEELHVPFKDGFSQKRRIQYISYFSKGFIGMASPEDQPKETIDLLDRFTSVFNLTFTRFNDLKIAEAHALQAEQDLVEIKSARKKAEDALSELQVTQRQLIQSEKMASLGELTAGIAHEIQNPLNFVNNFSEVSNELIDEINDAIEKGDREEVKIILNDVKQNLEKINHHGKRADAIVKGMLQHSRQTKGVKEPTDINALCDEYLRLSYHGLRAKDKEFNANFKTDFDSSIGKINIIPQDIGRVILNLINNAFYAVNEKALSAVATPTAGKYEPMVSVSTKKLNTKIEIIITDNGNGISSSIKDKIFQPFFTTKPTGQGTGLGLSLAYDIIKAHGGALRLDTNVGIGSEFIIELPNQNT